MVLYDTMIYSEGCVGGESLEQIAYARKVLDSVTVQVLLGC